MSPNPAVLVIGGSDSSGGAGITRDLRTLHDLGMRGVAALTAVTAQTNATVRSITPISPDAISDQVETAFASNDVRAVKIGMLGTRSAVETVSRSLRPRGDVPMVLDPVLAASSGRALLEDAAQERLIELLLPRATLVTPNAIEAARLLGEPVVTDAATLERYAQKLLALGVRAVLLKGGHADGDASTDVLVSANHEPVRLHAPRRPGTLRGTGCALASAIAASLARGVSLPDACREGKRYIGELFDGLLVG